VTDLRELTGDLVIVVRLEIGGVQVAAHVAGREAPGARQGDEEVGQIPGVPHPLLEQVGEPRACHDPFGVELEGLLDPDHGLLELGQHRLAGYIAGRGHALPRQRGQVRDPVAAAEQEVQQPRGLAQAPGNPLQLPGRGDGFVVEGVGQEGFDLGDHAYGDLRVGAHQGAAVDLVAEAVAVDAGDRRGDHSQLQGGETLAGIIPGGNAQLEVVLAHRRGEAGAPEAFDAVSHRASPPTASDRWASK
jgi:hypothetical protein